MKYSIDDIELLIGVHFRLNFHAPESDFDYYFSHIEGNEIFVEWPGRQKTHPEGPTPYGFESVIRYLNDSTWVIEKPIIDFSEIEF